MYHSYFVNINKLTLKFTGEVNGPTAYTILKENEAKYLHSPLHDLLQSDSNQDSTVLVKGQMDQWDRPEIQEQTHINSQLNFDKGAKAINEKNRLSTDGAGITRHPRAHFFF